MKPKSSVHKVLRMVEDVTDSEPVKGEDLLRSPKLKLMLREAKKAEAERKAKRKR